MRNSLLRPKKLIPILLLATGLLAIGLAGAADLLGLGDGAFGPAQIICAILGGVSALVGIFLLSAPGSRLYETLEKRMDARLHLVKPVGPVVLWIWFGVVTGLAESLILAHHKFINHNVIKVNSHFVWMAPLANVLLFSLPTLLFLLLGWYRHQRVGLRLLSFVFTFLAFTSMLFNYPGLHLYSSLLLSVGLAYQTSRLIALHAKVFYAIVRFTVFWIVATVSVLGFGVWGWEKLKETRALADFQAAPASATNVLLIVMDTVRAESMSLYGYSERTTPHLENLARTGVVFERALATSSWTLPSHASMFTGRYQHEMPELKRTGPVELTNPTLAELLSTQGYRTGGFVANLNYATEERGLARGFTHYEDYPISLGQVIMTSSLGLAITNSSWFRQITDYHDMLNDKNAERVNADFLRWLDRDKEKPFFAFLNYYDAHEPYLPPRPFDQEFGPTSPLGEFTYLGTDIEQNEKWKMSPEQIAALRNSYEGSIAYLDNQISLLIRELEQRGILQNTLVIITSDHGEQFGKNKGLFGHGNSLYYTSVHVPLLCLFPARIPSDVRVSEPVSLRDLPNTVIDLIGLEPAKAFPGESLRRFWDRGVQNGELTRSSVLSEVDGGFGSNLYPIAKGDLKSVVAGRYHLIQNADGIEELYDIHADPFERQNLIEAEGHKATVHQLREELKRVLDRTAATAAVGAQYPLIDNR